MSGALTHTPANVLRYLIISLGHGTLPEDAGAWPVHWSNGPDTPDSMIVVTDTSGRQQGRIQVAGQTVEFYGVQIAIRDARVTAGSTKWRAIAVALDEDVKIDAVTISSSVYVVYSVTRVNMIDAGKEADSDRRLFTINVLVSLRQTT